MALVLHRGRRLTQHVAPHLLEPTPEVRLRVDSNRTESNGQHTRHGRLGMQITDSQATDRVLPQLGNLLDPFIAADCASHQLERVNAL
jgi:hypothetical protein